jgi:hypothetical protein
MPQALKSAKTLGTISLLFVSLLLSSCWRPYEAVGKEIMRVTSPNGKIDAVMTKWEPGVSAETCYKLYLVPHGAHPTKYRECFSAAPLSGPKLEWTSNQRLIIHFDKAWVAGFNSRWYKDGRPTKGKPFIQIELAPSDLVP